MRSKASLSLFLIQRSIIIVFVSGSDLLRLPVQDSSVVAVGAVAGEMLRYVVPSAF
jgi:hypothetical protein